MGTKPTGNRGMQTNPVGCLQMAGTVKAKKAARHATSDWMKLEQDSKPSRSEDIYIAFSAIHGF